MVVRESGPIFLKVVNAEGFQKNKNYISGLMEKVIHEVGPKNSVKVITYNAFGVWAVELDIEGKFPNIFWTPCMCCPHFESCIKGYLYRKAYGGQFGDL